MASSWGACTSHAHPNTPFSTSDDTATKEETLLWPSEWPLLVCTVLSFSWSDRPASIIRGPSAALLYTGSPLCSQRRDSWLKQCKSQRALSQWGEQRHIHCVTDGSSMLPSCPTLFSHSDVVRTSDNIGASSAYNSKNCKPIFEWKNKQAKKTQNPIIYIVSVFIVDFWAGYLEQIFIQATSLSLYLNG